MARLSVIITTHNRQHLLPHAIESIRNCGTPVRIIVVDDASEDGTSRYCEGLSDIHYIRLDKNRGTAAARNTGLNACTTELVAFLDDDDWRLPGTFEEQITLLEADPACVLVYGKVYYANQQRELTGESNMERPAPQGDILSDLLYRNFITLSTVVVRKEALIRTGFFDESVSMLGLEDWDMWLRLSAQYQIRAVLKPVSVYRKPEKDSGQWYSDLGRQSALAARAYRKKWFLIPGVKEKLGDRFPAVRKQIMAQTSGIILYSAMHQTRGLGAKISRLYAALRCWPKNLVSISFYKTLVKSVLGIK